MKVITTAVIKGGTGKTTTAAALAQAGTAAGMKVLAIDLDPQGNLSAALAADPAQAGSYELLLDGSAKGKIQTTPQEIDVIAASPNLAAVKTRPGSARRLQEALTPLEDVYGLVIIDTPPTAGILTYTALQAATGLLIPLEADTHSLQGLYNIEDIAKEIQRSNEGLTFTGVILTRYDSRPKINRYLRDTIKETSEADGIKYLGEVRAGIAIREAQAMGQSLYRYAPRSNPAKDYEEIFNNIMEG